MKTIYIHASLKSVSQDLLDMSVNQHRVPIPSEVGLEPPRALNGEEAIHKDTGKTDHDSGKGCKCRDLVHIQRYFVGENPCDE